MLGRDAFWEGRGGRQVGEPALRGGNTGQRGGGVEAAAWGGGEGGDTWPALPPPLAPPPAEASRGQARPCSLLHAALKSHVRTTPRLRLPHRPPSPPPHFGPPARRTSRPHTPFPLSPHPLCSGSPPGRSPCFSGAPQPVLGSGQRSPWTPEAFAEPTEPGPPSCVGPGHRTRGQGLSPPQGAARQTHSVGVGLQPKRREKRPGGKTRPGAWGPAAHPPCTRQAQHSRLRPGVRGMKTATQSEAAPAGGRGGRPTPGAVGRV